MELVVAPVRERGLKWQEHYGMGRARARRSRKGAWIEMATQPPHPWA